MKKITAILLASLIIFDSCGYVFIYLELSSFFKSDALTRINDFIPDKELEILTFAVSDLNHSRQDLQFLEHNEIRYRGSMYDIFKTEYKSDSVFFYCLNDKKESYLEQAFSKYIESKTNESSKNIPISNILHNIIKTALAPVNFNEYHYQSSIKFITVIQEIIPQFSKDIPTPPPKS
jgi:hypothetical protein